MYFSHNSVHDILSKSCCEFMRLRFGFCAACAIARAVFGLSESKGKFVWKNYRVYAMIFLSKQKDGGNEHDRLWYADID